MQGEANIESRHASVLAARDRGGRPPPTIMVATKGHAAQADLAAVDSSYGAALKQLTSPDRYGQDHHRML